MSSPVLLYPASGSMVVEGVSVGEGSVDAKRKRNAGYYAISGLSTPDMFAHNINVKICNKKP